MKLLPSVNEDIPQIQEWVNADSWHQNQKQPEWWLTGTDCFLAGCVQDDIGPVVYFKVEEESEAFRLHVQFAPRTEVSRRRLIIAIAEVGPALFGLLLSKKSKIVFSSSNPSLVRFMRSAGFKPDLKEGEYALCVDQALKNSC